jgi:putative acetyltransferase
VLVDRLREDGALAISMVAVIEDRIVGHVAFSPASAADGSKGWFALGPVSVEPARQAVGIGSSLIRAGLEELRRTGAAGCILTGDPEYYGRFGFELAPDVAPPGQPKEYFQVVVLNGPPPRSIVRFLPAFETKKARAVIFDYSGVVHREDGADWEEIARGHGLPPGRVWAAVHDIPEYGPSRRGEITPEAFRAAVKAELARWIDEGEAEGILRDLEEANRGYPPVDPEMAGILERLRGRVRLGLLTNGGRGSHEKLVRAGVVPLFDDVVCSGDVGLAKPDPEVFRFAARRLGVEPAECLFVDDLERNVAGARTAGMAAHLHHRTRMPDLLRFLGEHGLRLR